MKASTKKASVANEILRQLGGANRLVAMTGAKDFEFAPDRVSFSMARKRIIIRLDPSDTYEVTFMTGSKLKTYDDIYAGNLKRLIEKETGMYLSL